MGESGYVTEFPKLLSTLTEKWKRIFYIR